MDSKSSTFPFYFPLALNAHAITRQRRKENSIHQIPISVLFQLRKWLWLRFDFENSLLAKLFYSLFEHQSVWQVSLWLWNLNQTKSKRTEISCSLRKSPPNQNQIKSIDSPNIYVELRAVEKRFFLPYSSIQFIHIWQSR